MLFKKLFYVLPFAVMATACSDQEIKEDLSEESTVNELKGNYASASSGYRWTTGQTIRYKFVNGTTNEQIAVSRIFKEWMAYANLKFVQVNSGDAEIRIKFEKYGTGAMEGGHTYLGKLVELQPQSVPNMVLYVSGTTKEDYFKRVVRHEIGHVIGFYDEVHNQSAKTAWTWKKSNIITDIKTQYKKNYPNATDAEALRYAENFYNMNFEEAAYTANESVYKVFDPNSIMMWDIPARWSDYGKDFYASSELSSLDKKYARQMYSYGNKEHLWRYSYMRRSTNGFVRDYMVSTTYNNVERRIPNIAFPHYFTPGNYISPSNPDYFANKAIDSYCESIGFVYTDKVANTVPLYSYTLNGADGMSDNNFVTTNYRELGEGNNRWIYGGVIGFVYNTAGQNRTRVYRYKEKTNGLNHLYFNEKEITNNPSIVPNNYILEGTAFYIELQ